jgi:predicted RNase H-like HicB family nuclease
MGHIEIRRSSEREGVWLATCLDEDVVVQGGSPEAALNALREALMSIQEAFLAEHDTYLEDPGRDKP